MPRDKDFPEQKPVKVDWSDPALQSLLLKTENWQLDKRRSFAPLEVRIHQRWDIGMPQPARLLDMHEDMLVLETEFPLPSGEHVRVDRPLDDPGTSLWGVVMHSRPAARADELTRRSQLHWLRRVDADD